MSTPKSAGGTPPASAGEMVARGRAFLENKGIESARLEAELLVANALGLDRMGLFLALDRPVEPSEVSAARDQLVRRANGEPTAYITGTREFYGRPFGVGKGVLIPRSETELLVDLARERTGGRTGARIVDVGTGSGCIAVSLALECQGATVIASDVSAVALARAARNVTSLDARVHLVLSDGLSFLPAEPCLDLVVSNPPYVDPAMPDTLGPGVLEHEPAEALFAPAGDPDHWMRKLLEEAVPRLVPGGHLLIELGFDQAARARALVQENDLEARLHADLAGIERVLEVGPRS